MADLPSARLVPVASGRLQLGMYVAELDRSWLHTPFHAHGFLITQAEQLGELRRICEYVYVDPALSERFGDGDFFTTGLTGRMEALQGTEAPTPLARQRNELRALGHSFATAIQGLRRSEDLALEPLRRALEPVVASLAGDADTIPWLLATELRVGFLHRRALGTAVLMGLAGRHIGFERPVLDELALAGLLLDIGKVSVPVTILAKAEPLSGHERDFIERHVRRGLYLVRASSAVSETLEDALLGHHERLDGSGYPRRLRGTQIPLPARLAGLADTYDALLQDRRYAAGIAAHDAMRVVNGLKGRKFDAAIVRSFIRGLGLYPTGSWLQVADGRIGIVRQQAPGEPSRPRIALISDSAGRRLPAGPVLWQPIRRGDVVRTLSPRSLHIERLQLDEALASAAALTVDLAA